MYDDLYSQRRVSTTSEWVSRSLPDFDLFNFVLHALKQMAFTRDSNWNGWHLFYSTVLTSLFWRWIFMDSPLKIRTYTKIISSLFLSLAFLSVVLSQNKHSCAYSSYVNLSIVSDSYQPTRLIHSIRYWLTISSVGTTFSLFCIYNIPILNFLSSSSSSFYFSLYNSSMEAFPAENMFHRLDLAEVISSVEFSTIFEVSVKPDELKVILHQWQS